MEPLALGMRWEPDRPRILVAACSDGRLQEATDAFLARALGVRQYDRLYLPHNDPRYLRRNALVAAGNVGGQSERAAVERHADGDDELLREHALWALERLEERGA